MALLLMTATVTPPANALNLTRTDPRQRLKDYSQALLFYIGLLDAGVFDGIVFVDNSNSDIAALRAIATLAQRPERIELISYLDLDYPAGMGRAYGELRLLDRAMATSQLIRNARPDDVIWKVTGRYIVENIARLVKTEAPADFYCHCRNLPSRWVDMFLVGWRKAAYAAILQGAADRVGGGAEVELRALIDEKARSFDVRRRFREAPKVIGTRGWDNQRYESEKAKAWVRSLATRFTPWIWI